MLNLNYNINNSLRNQRNFLKGKVDYRWRRTITTAAGLQSGSIIFGTGSILFVPFQPNTYFVSDFYEENQLESGSAIGQTVRVGVTGSGEWPTTGSNSMYILIGSSLGFNQNEILNMSAQAGNMNLSGSIISSSFVPEGTNEYNIDFGINHTKGNIYNPLVLWKTMQEEDITELSTDFPINGYTSSFNIVKNENELLVNVVEVSGSFSSSFEYLYNFGVTASLTASINNATGSTTMSFFIPETGLSYSESWFNPITSVANLTASFVATTDSPYNVTASVEYNKGNQSTASIDYVTFQSSSTQDLEGDSTNLNGVSSSLEFKKDNGDVKAFVSEITGSEFSSSYTNEFSFNQTASLIQNVNNTTGSVTMSINFPTYGVNVTQSFYNPSTTQAVLSASIAATSNDKIPVTASVINNKGNESNSNINWEVTSSRGFLPLDSTASFQIEKDTSYNKQTLVDIDYGIDPPQTGSFKNAWAFNMTASISSSYVPYSSGSEDTFLVATLKVPQIGVNNLWGYATESIVTASWTSQTSVANYDVTASVQKYTTRPIEFAVIGGGGLGGLPINLGGGPGGGAGGGAGAVVTGSIKMLKDVPYTINVGKGGYNIGYQAGSIAPTNTGVGFEAEPSSIIGEVVPVAGLTPNADAELKVLPYITAPAGGGGASGNVPVDGGSGGGQRADAAGGPGLSISASVILEGQMTQSNLPYGSCGVVGGNRELTINPLNPGNQAFIGGNGGGKETIIDWLQINGGAVGGYGRRGDNSWSPGINGSFGAVGSSAATLPVTGTGAGGGGSYRSGNTSGAAPRPGATGSVSLRYTGDAKAIGGQVVSSGSYTIHTFLTSSTFLFTGTPITASIPLVLEYLVVGMGGDTTGFETAGGGGGGQVVTGSTSINLAPEATASFNVLIGGDNDGSLTSSLSSGSFFVTASKGGNAVQGSSKDGGSSNGFIGGAGIGNTYGGGGAGATQNGSAAGFGPTIFGGKGGDGYQWIDGLYYAGGGGGATRGLGGIGGGGNAPTTSDDTPGQNGLPGQPNTGGGAGGNWSQSVRTTLGGTGVVKLRYFDPSGKYEPIVGGNGVVEKTLIGNYTYITIKNGGDFQIKLNT
jgi:hypothetical protein